MIALKLLCISEMVIILFALWIMAIQADEIDELNSRIKRNGGY